MARILFSFFLVCLWMLQALAVPLESRIRTLGRRVSAVCSNTNTQLAGDILAARSLLANVNSMTQLRNQEPFLNAQLTLLSLSRIADKVTDKIALAALNGTEPARDNAHRLILSGLNDVHNILSTIFAFEMVPGQTTENVQQASSNVVQAIGSAQQAVALNCTNLVAGSFATTTAATATMVAARQMFL
ncbi:hypothetical protein FB451DRAFT_1565006 [Mycena latifolia]|nr:hypothetical protein FB451DRAFT_1565006 [Mycena latifolia]